VTVAWSGKGDLPVIISGIRKENATGGPRASDDDDDIEKEAG
jgi:hypothetical protein